MRVRSSARRDEAQAQALSRYGAALGAAFQVADDILDAEGDTAALGKRAGKDAERDKATLVSLLGLEGAQSRAATSSSRRRSPRSTRPASGPRRSF